MRQFRCCHLELASVQSKDARPQTYWFGVRQGVTSLTASLVFRQLIRCARFGADIRNGGAIAQCLELQKSSSLVGRKRFTYADISLPSNESIGIDFQLFGFTQIQLQVDRQLNDRK